ncbi:uncharacterized protein P884DRAFT_264019 [Thermothelomyces heterothallicus CBS 202.75]|uniref:uncharacterized protein n=1 Tax=Thermothelomyces heterothallicus CBS 202.75 TaxID=1149848 RepID=UPI003743BE68
MLWQISALSISLGTPGTPASDDTCSGAFSKLKRSAASLNYRQLHIRTAKVKQHALDGLAVESTYLPKVS